MKKYRFVIVGGGTAGMIAAAFFTKKWGNLADITVVYDHKNPGIGVGESLTPNIYYFLDYVGITRDEMVANVNATVKLGLKFKNWLNDGNYYYHNFNSINRSKFNNSPIASSLLIASYEIVHNIYDSEFAYGKDFMESSRIQLNASGDFQSLHIDAVLLGRFIENRIKDKINIIDGLIKHVVKKEEMIDSVILEDGRTIEGDFFIDCTGFNAVLMKQFDNEWVDKKDWLPLDRCIPNPIPWKFEEQPVYTTSEATDQGWILQVPLSNRWGTGYLYSSEFLNDENAFKNFEIFLDKNYGTNTLNNTSKVLKFNSGYWKKQWVKNCITVGLSSGFAEPLEATNIHHVVDQMRYFINIFNFKILDYDIEDYNRKMVNFYDNIYLYLRFCYTTKREDSEFWRYMTNTVPKEVRDLEEKIINVVPENVESAPFNHDNFTRVAFGLNKIDKNSWKEYLIRNNFLDIGRKMSSQLKREKLAIFENSISHIGYIRNILSQNKYNR